MLGLEAKFEQTWPLMLPGGVSGEGLGELQLSAKVWDRPAALGAFRGLELQAAQDNGAIFSTARKDEHGRVQSAGDSSFPFEQWGYVSRGKDGRRCYKSPTRIGLACNPTLGSARAEAC
ncbi:uncharacterized protein PG986_014991 [Apiospora aurea]|uniref:Uncharacterized protein n=1 Tax=Apiospora aurea TaxID=335848 RepID=A0ABR1PUV9_9PEZI